MPLRKHVYSVLLVSASEKTTASIRGLLPPSEYAPVILADTVSEAKRRMQERVFDLILVNAPLPDAFGRTFAMDAALKGSCVVALLVRTDLYDETFVKVFEQGVFTIRKPTSSAHLLQALDWMRAARERLRRLEKKTVSLEDKMAEIRLVNHAKWALIESLKMTEADAHRYIEKQAMDRCVTRREIAENILKTYS